MGKQPVEQLIRATLALDAKVGQASMEELLEFVQLRELLVQEISRLELSAQEREQYGQQLKALASSDQRIVRKLEEFKQEAAIQLQQIAASRTRKTAYEAGYAADSLFFDRKN